MRPTFSVFPPTIGAAVDGLVPMTFTVADGAGTVISLTVVVPAPGEPEDGYVAVRRALADATADLFAARPI